MPSRLPVLVVLAALSLQGMAARGYSRDFAERQPPAPPREALPQPKSLGEREVTIANRSALPITELYVSPTSSDAWGEDRLGEAILSPGRTLRLRLGRMRDCAFDVLVIYNDASREERPAQNLCRTRQVSLDGKARTPPAAPPPRHVVLSNQSGRAIQQVFVSPADGPDWGEDLLSHAISVGDSGTVAFRGPCTADIRIVFENRAAEERRGIDLCRRTTLSIEPGWTTSDDLPVPPA